MTSSNYWGHLFTKKVNFHKYDITCMELCQYYYHFKILLVHYVNTATHMELKTGDLNCSHISANRFHVLVKQETIKTALRKHSFLQVNTMPTELVQLLQN